MASNWPISYVIIGTVLFLLGEHTCCSYLVFKITRWSLCVFSSLVHSHLKPVTCCWDWTSQRCSAAWLLWTKWLQVSQHINTGSVTDVIIVGISHPWARGWWVQTQGLVYLYLLLSVQISAWAAIRCLPGTLHPTVLSRLSRCPVRFHWADLPSCCKTNFAVW